MINNVERIKKLKEENYQKIFGIKKNTFDKMLKLLNEAYRIEHLRGGHPPKLSVLDRLVICFHTIVTIELWKILPLNMVLQKVPSVSALNGLKTS
ncbi:putative transposase [Leptotrichia hofstadii]|uniref:Putative transposase n=1 Tax=Leptotrichia hofstadii TaxID=157688 RepID=A0A510JDT9_9FUSO|nr:hypothetical protein [Leptotrichia hofstadii]BBM37394.1 putative transposase [Leptotrichia hofstadii]